MTVLRDINKFSSAQFKHFCRGLDISLLLSPTNLNCLDEQIVANLKRRLLVSPGEAIVEENLNALIFRNQTTSHGGFQI